MNRSILKHARWVVACAFLGTLAWAAWLILLTGVRTGHRMPLGAHAPPSSGITILPNWPTAADLDRLDLQQPFVMKSCVRWCLSSDGCTWSDQNLAHKLRDVLINAEIKKKEDRSGSMEKMKFPEFIQRYHQEELYIVDLLPGALFEVVGYPDVFQKCWFDEIVDVLWWMSSGGTSSVLHADGDDNVLCQVEGVKQLIIIDKLYTDDVYHTDAHEGYGWRSPIDVDKVDLISYPRVATVPYYKVVLNPGDCVFMPEGWQHQVRSFGRNVAVNAWFRARSPNACVEKVSASTGALIPLTDPSWGYSTRFVH